jgi:hypothetical protein
MPLSPRVGGATSKPVDVSPSPVAQRFASNSCVTTKMTYEFFNELIENFTLAQVAYGVTNVPNDPNSLKKILDGLRTGGYNFAMGNVVLNSGLNTTNTNITLGTGKLYFTDNDYLGFDDANNTFSFFADGAINNAVLNAGILDINSLNVDTINEKTTNNGVLIDGIRIKDSEILFNTNDKISFDDTNNVFSFSADASVSSSKILCGELKVEIDAQGVSSDANGIKFFQNSDTSRSTFINSRGNVVVNIDSANLNTDKVFYIKKNDDTNGGTNLFSVGENGIMTTYNGDIHLGTGGIHFDDYDSDYMYHDESLNQYVFLSDSSISNSVIRAGNINLGNENLSLYRENVTFTATFFNGTTQITGSSGTTNVSSYDARVSRIGNVATVVISNIVLDVSGRCGTTLGTYPALTTTGEFSIRGLPYNALKDSFGSYIGFYNGNGQVNAGTVYIIAGTNNIRFSSTGFGDTFGIRGVTITYMV